MQRMPKRNIVEIKQQCREFGEHTTNPLPTPRNQLPDGLYIDPPLSTLLTLTMDRLEDRYQFGWHNRVKGCEEFLSYKKSDLSDYPWSIASYELKMFAETIRTLIEEFQK